VLSATTPTPQARSIRDFGVEGNPAYSTRSDEMKKSQNAPTKKVQKHIDSGLYVFIGGDDIVEVGENHPQAYQDKDGTIHYTERSYSMSWWINEQLHSSDTYNNLQDLANAMRAFRPLTEWCYADRYNDAS
jgi:hypothetical protein